MTDQPYWIDVDRNKKPMPILSIGALNANMGFLVRMAQASGVNGMSTDGLYFRSSPDPETVRRWKIVTNEDLGEYTVDAQIWNKSDGDWQNAPDISTVSAWEIDGRADGDVGAIVYGRLVDTADDEPVVLLVFDKGTIEFGKPAVAFKTGDTITLDPCDADGTDNGAPNATVFLSFSRGAIELPLATSAIISFIRFASPYLPGGTDPDVVGVVVGVDFGSHASPATLLPAAGDRVSELTAQTDTWDRADQSGTGVAWAGPRLVYDATNHKYFYFDRVKTWDASGRLAGISAETKTEVVALVDCTAA